MVDIVQFRPLSMSLLLFFFFLFTNQTHTHVFFQHYPNQAQNISEIERDNATGANMMLANCFANNLYNSHSGSNFIFDFPVLCA